MQFIAENIHIHKSTEVKLINGLGKQEYFSPYNCETLYDAIGSLDIIKKRCAIVKEEINDKNVIPGSLIDKHITRAVNTWVTSPFAQHVRFEEFCEYLLPYRAGEETFSDYLDSISSKYKFIYDSLAGQADPVIAAVLINNELKKWLKFDLRSHAGLRDPSIIEILEQKKGSCRSLTQFTAQVMRSVGITVAIDECPVWAHRNLGHQWNAVLDTTGKWIPFGGAETNPDEFVSINDSVKAPKIYRHTYSVQKDFQPPIKDVTDIPPVFRMSNRRDVTDQYVKTATVMVKLQDYENKEGDILYLSVFNAEQWQIVSWAKIKDGAAAFLNMGNNNIVYLPVVYKNGSTIPVANPIILTPNGAKCIVPDTLLKVHMGLKYYNRFFDFKWNIGLAKPGWEMELFYWDNKWVSCGGVTAGKDHFMRFSNIPKNALYWIKSYEWKNTWQRIFTIENREQVWY
jgi:hypothetical protein